ncbi:LLM class flavin-dependent oxidoreductase [Dactylosporangium sp. NPDC051484]|uniref:LLM class flavin-dependent oxidoreductase n=1 Tax=Dactylosporangium sp. NPDC051484 TaxID=3154942 RepID=UPI00344E71F3
MTEGLHLAVALDDAGWHPGAWREPGARPAELLTAGYWTDLVRHAERGRLDFVTIEDRGASAPGGPPDDERTDLVRGRLDALLIAARVAPLTSHIGLVPSVVTTHTEPFHVSTQLATLDYVSRGRAGWRVQIARDAGRDVDDLVAEAADHVEVVRRLWDSWEDGAEIRDVATGRFVDRERLHYVDFAGRHFSVKGPSITPRPPQGQPIVAALAHGRHVYEFAAAGADVVFVTPTGPDSARAIAAEVRALTDRPVKIFADLIVYLGRRPDGELPESDAHTFEGTPGDLADLLAEWHAAGLDGFRLRPGVLPADLLSIVDDVVPALRERGLFRTEYEAGTLRGHLGLERPASRYAASGPVRSAGVAA